MFLACDEMYGRGRLSGARFAGLAPLAGGALLYSFRRETETRQQQPRGSEWRAPLSGYRTLQPKKMVAGRRTRTSRASALKRDLRISVRPTIG